MVVNKAVKPLDSLNVCEAIRSVLHGRYIVFLMSEGYTPMLSTILQCFSPEMTLDLLQCPVSGLRDEQDAEEKAQGRDCCVDPEHSVVTNKLYQVGVADRHGVTGVCVLCTRPRHYQGATTETTETKEFHGNSH